jgi:hypothetical protein
MMAIVTIPPKQVEMVEISSESEYSDEESESESNGEYQQSGPPQKTIQNVHRQNIAAHLDL